MAEYICVYDLELYKLARKLSLIGWQIYSGLHWQDKKIMGDQFIESTDSFGANITEGYSRFHFFDKIKFYYNSRASLSEANDYWVELLFERKKVSIDLHKKYKDTAVECSSVLQKFINSTYNAKKNQEIKK
jgi:four helix bundle protein